MKRELWALFLLPLLFIGCATLKLTQDNVKAVLCTQIKEGAPDAGTVSDTFDRSGKIYLVCSMVFDDSHYMFNSTHHLKWRWYNGDKLISERRKDSTIARSPATFWFNTTTLSIGIGKGHVELYDGDTLLISKSFEIVETLPAKSAGDSTTK